MEKIIEIISKYTEEGTEITEETSIYDTGINSLDLASIICEIENEFECEIDEDKLVDIEKISDIYKLLDE